MARLLMGAVMIFQMTTTAVLADDSESEQPEEQDIEVVEVPLNPGVEALLDCISWAESRNKIYATNPRSGAAGPFQFVWSTWKSTPQGRAGLSPYDPVAARTAARWMIAQGRVREWAVVKAGLC